MKTALWIITTPERNYLSQELASMTAAGISEWEGPLVLAGDSSCGVPGGFESRPGSLETSRMWLNAINEAEKRGWDRLLLLEDDVVFCKNALLAIQHLEIPTDLAYLSFFSRLTGTEPGIHRRKFDSKRLSYFQATLLGPEAMWNLRSWLRTQETPTRDICPVVTHAMSACRLGYGIVAPHWVRHIGHQSTLGHFRTDIESHAWPGQDHDALADLALLK